MDGTLPKIPLLKLQSRGGGGSNNTPGLDKFQILAAWSRAQKKHITEFTEFSTWV